MRWKRERTATRVTEEAVSVLLERPMSGSPIQLQLGRTTSRIVKKTITILKKMYNYIRSD